MKKLITLGVCAMLVAAPITAMASESDGEDVAPAAHNVHKAAKTAATAGAAIFLFTSAAILGTLFSGSSGTGTSTSTTTSTTTH